ncbi:MAG: hypothetical protein AAFO69_06820, partial [Bacteroidota bacterium]
YLKLQYRRLLVLVDWQRSKFISNIFVVRARRYFFVSHRLFSSGTEEVFSSYLADSILVFNALRSTQNENLAKQQILGTISDNVGLIVSLKCK